MTLIRKFAIQGHSVPSSAHTPRGPFPPEVLAKPEMAVEEHRSDSLHAGLDDVRFFKCKECEEVLLQDELDNHECGD